LRRLEIILVVGREDVFLESNNFLSQSLFNKGIFNTLHVWGEEAHRPKYWRRMVDIYL
jgi:esterase/lipase superfamily enzyme